MRLFDRDFAASYDREADVLYLLDGDQHRKQRTSATPEGHAVSFDADDAVIGLTLVNAAWLLERDGDLAVTGPLDVTLRRADLAELLTLEVKTKSTSSARGETRAT